MSVFDEFDNSASSTVQDVLDDLDTAITVGPVFGSQFQSAESLGPSVTGLSTYVEKLRLTTTSLPNGTYRIGWSYGWSVGSETFFARIQLDDTTTLMEHQIQPAVFGGTSSPGDRSTGFFYQTLNGVHNIDLDFRSDNGGSVGIFDVRIELWRVP